MSNNVSLTEQDFSNISPVSLYSTLADFSTDSSPSPETSPISPVFTNPYALPTAVNDWPSWDDMACDNFSGSPPEDEPFDDAGRTNLASIPLRNASASPGVDPMQLCSNPSAAPAAFADDDVPFCCDGLDDTQARFMQQPQQQQQQPPSISTATTEAAPRRMPSYELTSPPAAAATSSARHPSRKCKSRSGSSGRVPLSSHSSPSPPPPPSPSRAAARRTHVAAAGPPKKTAHNMIEKRYRTNLNDKIKALRDAVPALRIMARKSHEAATSVAAVGTQRGRRSEDAEMTEFGGRFAGARVDEERAAAEEEEDEEDLRGLVPVHKLNKATILNKATEYIGILERQNQSLAKENAMLRGKVEGFNIYVMSGGGGGAAGGMWGGPYLESGPGGNLQMLPARNSLN